MVQFKETGGKFSYCLSRGNTVPCEQCVVQCKGIEVLGMGKDEMGGAPGRIDKSCFSN